MDTVVEKTCTRDGKEVCSRGCGYTRTIPKGHVWGDSSTYVYVDSCGGKCGTNETGTHHLVYKKCKVCGALELVTSNGGHTYAETSKDTAYHEGSTNVTKAPDCTNTGIGWNYRSCTLCGHSLANQVTVPALGHKQSTAYKYDANGHWKYCTRSGCSYAYSSSAHTWSYGAWTTTKESTYTATGEEKRSKTCSVCGYSTSETRVKEKKVCSHSWGAWVNKGSNHSRTCSICGAVETDPHSWGSYYYTGTSASSNGYVYDYYERDCAYCSAYETTYSEASKYTITLNNQGATTAGTTSLTEIYRYSISPATISVPSKIAYTVSFNGNGGTAGVSSRSSYYSFEGYYTSTGGRGTRYIRSGGYVDASSTTFSGNSTLYASWGAGGAVMLPSATRSDATSMITVTYDANGGSCSTSSAAATRTTRYSFAGWYSASSGGTYKGTSGSTYVPTSSETLYAHWSSSTSSTSVTLPTPARTKYKFIGWYTASSGGTKVGDAGATYAPSGTLTLYAHWEKNDLAADIPVNGSGTAYTAGTDVITSFFIANDTARDIVPGDNVSFRMQARYYKNGTEYPVTTLTQTGIVVPKGEKNLVWFKWTVPAAAAGCTMYITGTANPGGALGENDMSNNTVQMTVPVVAGKIYTATDPVYADSVPAAYQSKSPSPYSSNSLTWSVWEYSGGSFVKKTYVCSLGSSGAEITPDSSVKSAYRKNGVWYMKSGYGFTLTYTPALTALSGTPVPTTSMTTGVQTAVARFREFNYETAEGRCRTLDVISGRAYLPYNAASRTQTVTGGKRIHYTPVWLPDGDYVVNVDVADLWTPAGEIRGTVQSNAVKIEGSMYEDFYYGR